MIALLLTLATVASDARATSSGLEIPNAIVRQHNAYVTCQDEHFDVRRVTDQKSFTAEAEKAIAACTARKAVLKQEAEEILASAPDYADASTRREALCESFDGYDEMRRAMALGAATFKDKCK